MSAGVWLDLPEVRALYSPMSVDLYHTLPETNERGRPTELLCGVVVEKVRKSPLRCTTINYLYERWQSRIPAKLLLRQSSAITFADSEPEPDLSVVCGGSRDYREHHPSTAQLVVEVATSHFSISSAKAAIYAAGGVVEYWVVFPEERIVKVHRQPLDGRYNDIWRSEVDATVTSVSLPDLDLPSSDLRFGA